MKNFKPVTREWVIKTIDKKLEKSFRRSLSIFATKKDLNDLRNEMNRRFELVDVKLEDNLRRFDEMGKHHVQMLIEQYKDDFRIVTDYFKGLHENHENRITTLEEKIL